MHVINEDSIRINLKHRQEQLLAEAARDHLADQARQHRSHETRTAARSAWAALAWLASVRIWGTVAGGRG